MDTNNEIRPLLLMVGKDTNSKTFTLLRVHLPNQTNWTFRWVFCQLLPSIYDHDTLSMIHVIIKDGNSQEINQLDAAIDEFFPQAKRVRCDYHIVNRGWDNKIEKFRSFPPSQTKFYEKVKTQIHTWMYSWMKSECQTKNEYQIGRASCRERVC